MAVNIAAGNDFPLFWYGQTYAGALEAYVAALAVLLFGNSELAMSLSPIFFSTLWLIATYLLFSQLLNRKYGLFATLAALLSGYFVWYYNFSLSGGYAVIPAFGVLIFALVAAIYRQKFEGWLLLSSLMLIGLLAGLGVWVHFFIMPYLVVSGCYLAIYMIQHRRGWRYWLPGGILGLFLFVLGLVPFYWANNGAIGGTGISSFILSAEHVQKSLRVLLGSDLFRHLFWDIESYPDLLQHMLPPAFAILASLFAVFSALLVVQRGLTVSGFLAAMPLAYILLFLAVFLPHRMSEVNSPRYLCAVWSMMVSVFLTYGTFFIHNGTLGKVPRILTHCAVLFWLGHAVYGMYAFAIGSQGKKAEHENFVHGILTMVDAAAVQGVHLLGDPLFSLEGQRLSAAAGNRIRFASAFDERYQKNAQELESEEHYGFLVRSRDKAKVAGALQSLAARYQEADAVNMTLFHNIEVPVLHRASLSPAAAELSVLGSADGGAGLLGDRDLQTDVQWHSGQDRGVRIRFDEVRCVNSLWLFGADAGEEGVASGLPSGYSLYQVEAGKRTPVKEVPALVPHAYAHEGHAYLSGYFARMEVRFPPVCSRELLLSFPGGEEAAIAELVLFEEKPHPGAAGASAMHQGSGSNSVAELARYLEQHRVERVFADRLMSALLLAGLSSRADIEVFPRFNPVRDRSQRRHSRLVLPGQHAALVVESAIGEDVAGVLKKAYGPKVIDSIRDFGSYTAVLLAEQAPWKPAFPVTYWNGHLLTAVHDAAALARVNAAGSGFPVFSPRYSMTRGVFHDGWTNGKGLFVRLDYPLPENARFLKVQTSGHSPFLGRMDLLNLSVLLNGKELSYAHFADKAYYFDLPPSIEQLEKVYISSSTFRPDNGDMRDLGVDVAYLEVE